MHTGTSQKTRACTRCTTSNARIPVVDLFAGPGGLGEGFSSLKDASDEAVFHNVLSIENDEHAHRTLMLRHFFRSFRPAEVPEDYFLYLNKEISFDELRTRHEARFSEISQSTPRLTLCEKNHDILKKTIKSRLNGAEMWVLVGGPPCQAYSLVGRARMKKNDQEIEDDERYFLYKEYLQIIRDHWPPIFVMENVKGILSAKIKDWPIIDNIIPELSDPLWAVEERDGGAKYHLFSLTESGQISEGIDAKSFIVRAEDHGIPQKRHRIFIVGVREDIAMKPRQLESHEPPTVEQMIGNLPRIRSGLSKEKDTPEAWRKKIQDMDIGELRYQLNGAEYAGELTSTICRLVNDDIKFPKVRASQKYPKPKHTNHSVLNFVYDDRQEILTGHESRGHMESDLRRYFFCAAFAEVNGRSPKLGDFPEALLPDHKNADLGRSGKMFCDRFRVQLADSYSTTITSHISKDGHYFIHYDPMQCRSLTVREAARLQTFPDDYHFEGPRTSQYHQIGNAVPPYLARQIAGVVSELALSARS